MAKSITTSIVFDSQFLENARRAAELRGVVFSEFVRIAVRDLSERTYREHGEELPDLDSWHLVPGGDFSEARAAKGGNYRKRAVLADKIDKAKKEARVRRNVKGNKRDVA